MSFGEEDHKSKVLLSSQYIKGTYCQNDTIINVNLDPPLDEVVFVSFIHCKVILFASFHTLLFGRQSLCAAHM